MVLLSFEKHKNYVQRSHSLEKQWDITNTPEHRPWMVSEMFLEYQVLLQLSVRSATAGFRKMQNMRAYCPVHRADVKIFA
jgi:hypothetical protein